MALRQAHLRRAPEQPLHVARSSVPHRGRRGGNELLPEAALPERAPADRGVDQSPAGQRAGRSASWAGSSASARRDARRSTSSTCCCRIRPGSICRQGTPTTTGRAKTACPGTTGNHIPWLIQQKYQRHLLQVEFTDRLLGRALDELHATGLYDRSLIVVTADHGESFGRPGQRPRRRPPQRRRHRPEAALREAAVPARGADRPSPRPQHRHPADDRAGRATPSWLAGRGAIGVRAVGAADPALEPDDQAHGERIRLSPKSLRRRAAASLRLKLSFVRQVPRSVRDRTAPRTAGHPRRALAGVAGGRPPR